MLPGAGVKAITCGASVVPCNTDWPRAQDCASRGHECGFSHSGSHWSRSHSAETSCLEKPIQRARQSAHPFARLAAPAVAGGELLTRLQLQLLGLLQSLQLQLLVQTLLGLRGLGWRWEAETGISAQGRNRRPGKRRNPDRRCSKPGRVERQRRRLAGGRVQLRLADRRAAFAALFCWFTVPFCWFRVPFVLTLPAPPCGSSEVGVEGFTVPALGVPTRCWRRPPAGLPRRRR